MGMYKIRLYREDKRNNNIGKYVSGGFQKCGLIYILAPSILILEVIQMRVLKCYDCGRSNVKLVLIARNDKIRLVCGCVSRGVRTASAKVQVAETPHSFQDSGLFLQVFGFA